MYYSNQYNSPIGKLTLASDGQHIVGLWIENQKYFGGKILNQLIPNDKLPIFTKTNLWLDNYFKGNNPSTKELPLAPIGSPFQQEVWKTLCSIPYGEITTYAQIAKIIAKRKNIKSMSSQAIGGAIGRNPISIIIPCHRVIGSTGNLTGYAAGINVKKQLLTLENKNASKIITY